MAGERNRTYKVTIDYWNADKQLTWEIRLEASSHKKALIGALDHFIYEVKEHSIEISDYKTEED